MKRKTQEVSPAGILNTNDLKQYLEQCTVFAIYDTSEIS